MSEGLRVIGVGMHRTGSMSVKSLVAAPTQALEVSVASLAVQVKVPVGCTCRSRSPVLEPR